VELAPPVESILITNKLTKKFGSLVAVDHIDLDVRRGEIYGFLGPNGAGKSTTIRMLLGLIRPSEGTALVFGKDIRKQGTEIRRGIGYLPGELEMYENLSARQFFEYSASLYGVEDIGFALELADRLNVTNLDVSIGSLSQGNKQKVGIVQALLHRPALVILDEPTNALDPLIRHELYEILVLAKSEGMTIFFSSHVLAEAERICDRVAIIREGKLSRVGTVEELKTLAPKRVRITFSDSVAPDLFQSIPGVTEASRDGDGNIELLVRQDLDDVIRLAAQHSIVDLSSEDMSLEEIFLGYYQIEGQALDEERAEIDMSPREVQPVEQA
jgi:ABC-2 type transport system ATP-binding protein